MTTLCPSRSGKWAEVFFLDVSLGRTLSLEGSGKAMAQLRLWVDLLTSEQSQSRPLAVLSSCEPEPYQLRVTFNRSSPSIEDIRLSCGELGTSRWETWPQSRSLSLQASGPLTTLF